MPHTQTATEELHELILAKLGDETCLDGEAAPFHENAVVFYSDSDPNPDFEGFTKKPLFETNLLLGEMDDDRKYRLERVGEFLIYTQAEGDRGGVTYIVGQALHCAVGSTEERAFMAGALRDVTEAASEPLVVALKAAREAGLPMDQTFKQGLLSELGLN
jgi:hypothetical protein